MSPDLPVILTCGDPAGIGPELAVKAIGCGVPFLWLGDPRHLPVGASWAEIAEPHRAADVPAGRLAVLRHDFPHLAIAGQPDGRNAAAVVAVIARAVALVQAGHGCAICTAPISKQVLAEGAGFAFPGHTEYLAHLAGNTPVAMMLACPELRVVPATIHIALSEVPAALTDAALEQAIRLTHAGLIADFGIPAPRIAVAGLNPHAGEGGRMGREEITLIAPLIRRLQAGGLDLRGPLSADTMFHAGARAGYDAAVCMYHDQALIPIKTIDFSGGVNVTLGLPFVRTSPDHGTAFDIAGRGLADATSLLAALRMAHDMAARRVRNRGAAPDPGVFLER